MNGRPTIPIDVELVRRILLLDPDTPSGLRWAKNYGGFAGRPAGHLNQLGYWTVWIKGRLYYAHRVIKAMMTGKDPGNVEVRR